MKHHLDLSLRDLPGEIWVDCYGLDGEYAVSNLGRIKSLERKIKVQRGERLIKARIRKQMEYLKNGKTNSLAVNINRKTLVLSRLVYLSFRKGKPIKQSEVIVHINQDPSDNSLENLKKVSRSDFRKQCIKVFPAMTNAARNNIKQAQAARLKYYKNRTHIKCVKCEKLQLLENYQKGRKICYECAKAYDKEYRKKRRDVTNNKK